MTTVTYEELHTEGLLTLNFSLLSENFKTIDAFIKNFGSFQRRLTDLEKAQKGTAQQLSNFKITTQNNFTTINDVVQSRDGASKPQSLADAQQIKQIKKSFKQIKTFITQNTRDQHEAQEVRDKEAQQVRQKLENEIKQIKKDLQNKKLRISNLQQQNNTIKAKYATKIQTQALSRSTGETDTKLSEAVSNLNSIQEMLTNLKVEEFKQIIDNIQTSLTNDFNELKRKFKLKADYSDVLKLQEMLLNIINYSFENSVKKFSDKVQTKKALVFFQKKLNRLFLSLYGDQQSGDKQALIATKGFKCISCTKDLGQMQGKLDKYKPWSVFPVKDSPVKDRYSGFGAGFQTIVETSVNKKGGDISYDEKGRMTTPYNLTREVQGTLLKPSQSQAKMANTTSTKFQSPVKNSPLKLETNYMSQYGKNVETQIDLRKQYMEKERGLMSHIKFILDSYEKDSQQKKQ